MKIASAKKFILILFLLFILMLVYCFRKMKHIKLIILLVVFIVTALSAFALYWAFPAKYTVREEAFDHYEQFLLVREVHYTGTGWVIVGDESGYFQENQIADVVLEGEKLPEASAPADYYNTLLCIVKDMGFVEHEAFEEKLACYEVLDWYPVYPVVRNRLLPPQFYPQGYMTKQDLKIY